MSAPEPFAPQFFGLIPLPMNSAAKRLGCTEGEVREVASLPPSGIDSSHGSPIVTPTPVRNVRRLNLFEREFIVSIPSLAAPPAFLWNVPGKPTIILGVCRGRQGKDFFGRVGNEKFLAGNAKALTSMTSVNLGSMGLNPGPVPLEPLVLGSGLCQRFRVGQLLHDQGHLFGSYHGNPLRCVTSFYPSADGTAPCDTVPPRCLVGPGLGFGSDPATAWRKVGPNTAPAGQPPWPLRHAARTPTTHPRQPVILARANRRRPTVRTTGARRCSECPR